MKAESVRQRTVRLCADGLEWLGLVTKSPALAYGGPSMTMGPSCPRRVHRTLTTGGIIGGVTNARVDVAADAFAAAGTAQRRLLRPYMPQPFLVQALAIRPQLGVPCAAWRGLLQGRCPQRAERAVWVRALRWMDAPRADRACSAWRCCTQLLSASMDPVGHGRPRTRT